VSAAQGPLDEGAATARLTEILMRIRRPPGSLRQPPNALRPDRTAAVLERDPGFGCSPQSPNTRAGYSSVMPKRWWLAAHCADYPWSAASSRARRQKRAGTASPARSCFVRLLHASVPDPAGGGARGPDNSVYHRDVLVASPVQRQAANRIDPR